MSGNPAPGSSASILANLTAALTAAADDDHGKMLGELVAGLERDELDALAFSLTLAVTNMIGLIPLGTGTPPDRVRLGIIRQLATKAQRAREAGE